MSHDDLMVMERHYMALAHRDVLTREEVQMMDWYQRLMREHKYSWEAR